MFPKICQRALMVSLLPLPLLLLAASAQASANFDIQKLADGVYAAIAKPGPAQVGSNAAIIVNTEGVLIVDTHMRPSYARELLEEVKKLTPAPVRYVVNTHWHNDHTQGNQAYLNAFPKGTEFLAHTNTRRDIIAKAIPSIKEQLQALPGQLPKLEEKLAGAANAEDRARLKAVLDSQRAYLAELKQMEITLPTLTFDRSLILHPEGREIRILYFGRGHTAGDVVVHLPKERVVITGDLLTGGIPFYRDAYPSEWAPTLKAVATLDFAQVIPGHGAVQPGKEQLNKLIAYMEEMVAGVKKMVTEGKSLEQIKAGLDLSKYTADFPNFPGGSAMAIERAYAEATGKIRD